MRFRCDKATEIGVTRLATVKCPTGLAFDIDRQTCDWKTNVKNCDQLESKKPIINLRLKFLPFPPLGVQGPAWSKSRVPADWRLIWTNKPATGRARSPTVTSSRVSDARGTKKPALVLRVLLVSGPDNVFFINFFLTMTSNNLHYRIYHSSFFFK